MAKINSNVEKGTILRLSSLNNDQIKYIKNNLRKYRYRLKRAGRVANDDTIINVMINKIV